MGNVLESAKPYVILTPSEFPSQILKEGTHGAFEVSFDVQVLDNTMTLLNWKSSPLAKATVTMSKASLAFKNFMLNVCKRVFESK